MASESDPQKMQEKVALFGTVLSKNL